MIDGTHLLKKGLSGAGMEAKRCVVICIQAPHGAACARRGCAALLQHIPDRLLQLRCRAPCKVSLSWCRGCRGTATVRYSRMGTISRKDHSTSIGVESPETIRLRDWQEKQWIMNLDPQWYCSGTNTRQAQGCVASQEIHWLSNALKLMTVQVQH